MNFKFDSLLELLRYFKDEKTCYDFLEHQIWHEGKPACPHCGSLHVYTRKSRSKKLAEQGINEYKCAEKGCNQNFTPKVGTIFESSKLPLQTWFAAIWLCTTSSKGVSSNNLAKQLGITQKSAWFVLSRIREMLKVNNSDLLNGMVEADETFIGGKNRNKSKAKRAELKAASGKKGKGVKPTDGKQAVLGLLQKDGNVRTFPMKDASKETLYPILDSNIDKAAILVTDGWQAYKEKGKEYAQHVIIRHDKDEWVNGQFSTNSIEGFWSQLKRGIVGVYHFTSAKHLHRYCDEYSYRYNARKLSSKEKFNHAIAAVVRARITYKELTD